MLCDKDTDLGTLQDYPYIVKPVDSSASRGVKKVTNHKELVLAFPKLSVIPVPERPLSRAL